MTTITVKFSSAGRAHERTVEAEVVTPGLAIHANLDRMPNLPPPKNWAITHVPSGLRVIAVDSQERAREIALRLGALTDWTKDENAVVAWWREHQEAFTRAVEGPGGAEPESAGDRP